MENYPTGTLFINHNDLMLRKILPTLLAILSLLIIWQLISLWVGFPAIFPSLPDLFKNIADLLISDYFFSQLSATVLRGLVGFGISFIVAFIAATTASFSTFWKAFFQPFIVVIRSIPVISLVLIALLWFAPSNLPVFIALLTMLPILYQNILSGLEQTDKRLVEMATVFGKSEAEIFHLIYMPSARKIIFAGVSTAMGFGWRAIIIGEVLAQPLRGIGTSMKQAQAYINVSELIAWTVVAIGVSYLFEFLIKGLEKLKTNPHLNTKYNKTQSFEIKEIKITNLIKRFNNLLVLNSYNQSFKSTTINCLKSPSGSGKTTLLRVISGLEKADGGSAKMKDNYSIAYSFQDVRLLPWLTVEENIFFGMNAEESESHKLLFELLEAFELTDHAHKFPHELSGGQQQRVGLIRALAAQSDVLLLDEPLTGLDDELKIKIIVFVSEWVANHKPLVLWATHENISTKNIEIKEFSL